MENTPNDNLNLGHSQKLSLEPNSLHLFIYCLSNRKILNTKIGQSNYLSIDFNYEQTKTYANILKCTDNRK